MTYVVSDLHGNYDKFKELMDKIGLKETDILYVLGDIVDYGEQSMELIGDLSVRYNVYAIAGEHDYLAVRMLAGFEKMLSGEQTPDADFIADMQKWVANGGQATLDAFRELDSEMREGVIDYLSEFALYEEVEAGGKEYVLTYAGIADFDPDTALEDYQPEDFFVPAKKGERFFDDRVLIVGCTPTESGRIERDDGVIRLDCGALQGGSIACLCLESGEEFYV